MCVCVCRYSLLRHPQALGNLLFVCGFALTGGSLWSALAFLGAGMLYGRNIVPLEEQMLTEAFPNSYVHYCERVPRFSGALLLLLVVQTAVMIRYGMSGGIY
jgi:protein-S-isoprenylcysteine O-methyltransferase Ste14